MKKVMLALILIIMTLFINIPVHAADNDHYLIYDIENFSIKNDTITFEGWAFVLNFWNKGGENAKISITANGEKIKNETVTYYSNYDKDIYEANCIKYDKTKKCTDTYDTATCAIGNELSNCRYDNMKFKITIPVQSLIDEFGSDKVITFDLNILYTGNNKTYKKSIAVANDSTTLKNGDVIDGDNTKISISGISDYATIRVGNGRVVSEKGDFIYSSNYKWTEHKSFNIIKTSKNGKYPSIRMYNLAFNENNWGKCSGDGTQKYNCAISAPLGIAGKAIPGLTKTNGWAYATWLEIDGEVKITLGDPEEKTETCPKEYNNADETLYCEENGYYEQVVLKEITLTSTFSADDEKYNIKSNECTSHTGSITRKITANACITQKGFAQFDLQRNEIYSGGGFNFNVNYTGSATYEFCKENKNDYYITMKITDKYCCEDCCGGRCIACGTKGEEGYDPCCDRTPTYNCLKSKTSTTEITEESDEYDLVTEKMQTFLENPDHNAVTWSLDSNKVDKEKTLIEIGDWSSDYDKSEDSDTTHWEPGEEVTYELNFGLDTACINRQTAKVRYTTGRCNSDEVDGGELYYVPIKQGLETGRGTFPVKVSIDDVNVLKSETWSIDYECDVNCRQDLYNPDGSFKFIYRPISLSNPFPGRTPGDNWLPFMEDFNDGKRKATSKMTRDTVEYEINLTPEKIISIKDYNKNKFYTDLGTINNSGRSSYLNELGITNKVRNNNYSELGECSNNYCWPTGSLFDGAW